VCVCVLVDEVNLEASFFTECKNESSEARFRMNVKVSKSEENDR
jgi:hypothetical protein